MSGNERIIGAQSQFGFLPESQSTTEIREILDAAKPGDAVHLVMKGAKLALYESRHRLVQAAAEREKQVHGIVQDTSAKGRPTLWGPWFAPLFSANGIPFDDEDRTFGVDDIEVIVLEPAEGYIPEQSEGRFSYLGEAIVQTQGGPVRVLVDSYIEGFVSGFEPTGSRAGNRITATERWFTPIRPQGGSSKTSD